MLSSSSSVSGLTASTSTSSITGSACGSGSSITGSGSAATSCSALASKLGSAQRSKALTSWARISSLCSLPLLIGRLASEHRLATGTAEHDLAGLGHASGDGEDFLLRSLHFADAHRALGLEVVAQQLGSPLGHVLEDLLLDEVVGALEGQHQHIRGDLAKQRLDAAVVDVRQVVE